MTNDIEREILRVSAELDAALSPVIDTSRELAALHRRLIAGAKRTGDGRPYFDHAAAIHRLVEVSTFWKTRLTDDAIARWRKALARLAVGDR